VTKQYAQPTLIATAVTAFFVGGAGGYFVGQSMSASGSGGGEDKPCKNCVLDLWGNDMRLSMKMGADEPGNKAFFPMRCVVVQTFKDDGDFLGLLYPDPSNADDLKGSYKANHSYPDILLKSNVNDFDKAAVAEAHIYWIGVRDDPDSSAIRPLKSGAEKAQGFHAIYFADGEASASSYADPKYPGMKCPGF
jgi:hypothetical protein